jgi:MFS family permease
VWGLAVPSPTLALIAFFLLWAATAASNGTITPAWYSMIAKVIPVRRRGLWSGIGHSLGALLGIVGGALAARILVQGAYPGNYALCFVLAFASVMVSYAGLASTREPVSPTVKPRTPQGHYLRQLPALLGRDGNYVRFLIARAVSNLGAMAGGFFMVYGKENIPGSLGQVGALTGILIGSQALTNLLWGAVADRRGHKVVLCASALFYALSAAVALASTIVPGAASPAGLWIAFALLGTAMSGNAVSRMNIILEFCAPEDRPTYIGLTNTLLAPAMLAPVLGGWLATWAGYRGLFLAATILSLLGAILLGVWVREPRHASP